MRLSLRFLTWRAVAAVERGVAEGLGWGSAKAGVFLWELTRCMRVKSGFTGFYFNFFRGRALTEASQHACSYACLIEEWQD